MDPLVLEAMSEIRFTLHSSFWKLANNDLVDQADLVISFKSYDELPEIIQDHNDIRYWNVPDPQHQSIEFHRKIRDAVKSRNDELVIKVG